MYILYQSDENYVPILGISMTSLFENNQDIEYLKVFVAEFKIKDESKNKLMGLAERYGREIEFLDMTKVDMYLEGTNLPKWRGNHSANYKLFLGQFLPDYVDRILYLDCDIVIMPGLAAIDGVDLSQHAISMARASEYKEYLQKMGKYNNYYHNTGIILFNVRNWKAFACENIILEKMNTSLSILCPDQDVINFLLPQFIKTMPIRFNVDAWLKFYGAKDFIKLFDVVEQRHYPINEVFVAVEKPVMVHCLGDFFGRPWENGNFCPMKKEWDLYRGMSPWPDFELERKPSKGREIIIYMYKILPRPVFIAIYKAYIKRSARSRIQALRLERK